MGSKSGKHAKIPKKIPKQLNNLASSQSKLNNMTQPEPLVNGFKQLYCSETSENDILCIYQVSENELFYDGNNEGRIIDIHTFETIQTLQTNEAINCVVRAENFLICAGIYEDMFTFNIADGYSQLFNINFDEPTVRCMEYNKRGSMLVIGLYARHFSIYKVSEDNIIKQRQVIVYHNLSTNIQITKFIDSRALLVISGIYLSFCQYKTKPKTCRVNAQAISDIKKSIKTLSMVNKIGKNKYLFSNKNDDQSKYIKWDSKKKSFSIQYLLHSQHSLKGCKISKSSLRNTLQTQLSFSDFPFILNKGMRSIFIYNPFTQEIKVIKDMNIMNDLEMKFLKVKSGNSRSNNSNVFFTTKCNGKKQNSLVKFEIDEKWIANNLI